MHHLTRRGYTLVELLVAITLLGIVSTGIYRVLVGNQRVYQAQTQRIDLQQNIRAAAAVLPAEFRELNAMDGDIQALSATSITIRAMRQLGVTCVAPVLGLGVNALPMMIHQNLFYGSALDPTTDSLLIFYEGDEGTRNDDSWVRANLRTVVNGVCPDGFNSPSYVLTVDLALPDGALLNRAGAIPNGAPVRAFQTITYELYQAGDGNWYIGLRPRGGTVQPLVGPLTDGSGLLLRYFNATGVVTAAPDSVAAIEITVRGRTAQRMHVEGQTGGLRYVVDSLTTRVTLRNNRRF
jgi:prepilin-type N-terminal cleavage/methylation domain-containing protein